MRQVLSTLSLVETRGRELDVLNQAVIATDAAGNVVYWNDVAQRLYGWSSAEAVGRHITDLTPTTQSREDAQRIMDALRAGRHWSGEFPVRRKDGSSFVAHVVDAPIHDEDGVLVGIVGLSSDISPVLRLQRLARDLSAAASPEEVAKASLDACLDVCGGAAGWFMTLEPDHEYLSTLYSVGYPEEIVARFHTVPLDAPFPIALAARSREPLFVTSPEEWRERFPAVAAFADARTRAWVALPLEVGDRVVGAIGISVRVERTFDSAERNLLVTMARHAGVALERALLYSREQDARRAAEAARSRAEAANKAKSVFLGNISHELRTPLGAIIGYHDLLADGVFGPLNGDQREHLQRLRNSATHLLSVIDGLLEFSRIEAGREVVRSERAQVGHVMQSVAEIVAPLARAKGLDFTVTCEAPDTELNTDTQKVKQIVVNLAGNAVKYTEAGSVAVRCSVEAGKFRVSVSDTGLGIAREHLESVFEPFWQVQERRARRSGGTGLGLSVSRSLASMLGGSLSVESEVGKGSTFTLEVPVGTPTD